MNAEHRLKMPKVKTEILSIERFEPTRVKTDDDVFYGVAVDVDSCQNFLALRNGVG